MGIGRIGGAGRGGEGWRKDSPRVKKKKKKRRKKIPKHAGPVP